MHQTPICHQCGKPNQSRAVRKAKPYVMAHQQRKQAYALDMNPQEQHNSSMAVETMPRRPTNGLWASHAKAAR